MERRRRDASDAWSRLYNIETVLGQSGHSELAVATFATGVCQCGLARRRKSLQGGGMRKGRRFFLPILIAATVSVMPAADLETKEVETKSGPLFETITRMDRH